MGRNFTYSFVLIISLCACSDRTNNHANGSLTIHVDPNDFESLTMGNLFSSIELIALDNSDDALFYRGEKMYFINNEYYILDRSSTCIFVFDAKGTFLRSSKHREGRGPGEYYYIADFNVLDNNSVEILDVSAYKIRRYTNEFTFIDEVDIPKEIYPITMFQRLTDELYAFHSSSSSTNKTDQVIVYSFKEGKVIQRAKGYISDPSIRPSHTQIYSFYEFDKEIFFSYPYPNDKVYRINRNGSEIKEVIAYDFGKYNFPFSKAVNHLNQFNDIMKGSHDYIFPTHRYENKEFIYTFVLYQEKLHLIRYRKDTNRTDSYSCSLSNGKTLLPPILIDEDFFYIIAEPSWLEYMISEELLSERSKEIYKNITESNNYVIVKYQLK